MDRRGDRPETPASSFLRPEGGADDQGPGLCDRRPLPDERAVTRHTYLEGRGIPAATLADPRFLRAVFVDDRGNAAFPHRDQQGLCGYEIKNQGFTGFSKGGDKGLWISAAHREARRLVVAESAIDALNHATLFPDPLARYASTAGKMNPGQPELIRAALLRIPEDAELIAATDADPDGRKLADQLRQIAAEAGRGFRAHQPPEEGTDWNDRLRSRPAYPVPQPQKPEVL